MKEVIPMHQIRLTSVLLLLLCLLLFGCGPSSSIADIQVKNRLSSEDIITLAGGHNVQLEKTHVYPASDEKPQAQIHVLQTKTGDFLLVADCEGSLRDRSYFSYSDSWQLPQAYHKQMPLSTDTAPAIAAQVITEFGTQKLEDYFCFPFAAKNLLFYYLPQAAKDTPADALPQPDDDQLASIARMINEDIHQVTTQTYTGQGEHFALTLTYSYYTTPYTYDDITLYDCQVSLAGSCRLLDAVPHSLSADEPYWLHLDGSLPNTKLQLVGPHDNGALTFDAIDSPFITGKPYDDVPSTYTANVQLGYFDETITLSPDAP